VRAFVNGGYLYYAESGNAAGTPVVFLHGFPFSHEMWREQINAAASKGFRAVAYDLRGHGMSDVGDGQYSIESHVNDLIGFLDLLKIPQAVIVGLSMGGYIALRALERNGDRFLATVLCDTRSEADSNEGKIRRAAQMEAVKKDGAEAFADQFVKAIFTAESLSKNTEGVQKIRTIIAHTSPLSIAGTLLALAARTDTTAALSSVSVPALILVGDQDAITSPDAAEAMHQRIRGSELHIIPGAAHMSNLENSHAFNTHLLKFLSKVSRKG
jgi:3-oxoadipate enol-lactonase